MLRFTTNEAVSADSSRDILLRSTLGERRPVNDIRCLQGMIEHSNLIVTAWDGQLLIGIEAFDEDRGQQRALFAWDRKVPDHAVDYGVPRTGLPEDEQQTRRIKTVRR
jgi:hypothetical protein